MKDIKPEAINEAVSQAAGDDASIQAATSRIMEGDVKPGSTVAIIDDPTYSAAGVKGKVKTAINLKTGTVDVELPGGSVVPMQASLLVPVAA